MERSIFCIAHLYFVSHAQAAGKGPGGLAARNSRLNPSAVSIHDLYYKV